MGWLEMDDGGMRGDTVSDVQICGAAGDGDQGAGAADAGGAMDEDRRAGRGGVIRVEDRGGFGGRDELEDRLDRIRDSLVGPGDALVMDHSGL